MDYFLQLAEERFEEVGPAAQAHLLQTCATVCFDRKEYRKSGRACELLEELLGRPAAPAGKLAPLQALRSRLAGLVLEGAADWKAQGEAMLSKMSGLAESPEQRELVSKVLRADQAEGYFRAFWSQEPQQQLQQQQAPRTEGGFRIKHSGPGASGEKALRSEKKEAGLARSLRKKRPNTSSIVVGACEPADHEQARGNKPRRQGAKEARVLSRAR